MRCGMNWTSALLMLMILAGGNLAWSAETNSAETNAEAAKWFEQHIRPVLAEHCLQCHGATTQESNLRLDSLEGLLAGGDSGAAVVKGKPQESLLIEALRYESFEMPPSGPLDEAVVARFEQWIAAGAIWPESDVPLRPADRPITAEDRQWWAFRPLARPAVPSAGDHCWPMNAIDHFVLQQLDDHNLRPAPPADETVLIRRLYQNLLGLPPTPEQIDQYFQGDPATRWEELVNRLLDDPAYGEHWGRFWLDVVRYAESDGWNQDAYRPHIHRYRDYVVRSFNEDRPYGQFVRQQLAGDEMPGDDPDNLAATGFLRLGIYEYNQRDAQSHWNDIVDEITDVTGDVFLGLGMSCARCHDHKFDPIRQRDYYRLRAFFEPLVWRDDVPYATEQQELEYAEQLQRWQEASAELQSQIDELLKPYHDRKWKTTVDKFPLEIQDCFYKPADQRTSWEAQMAYLVSRQFEEEGGGPLRSMSKEDKQRHEELKEQLKQYDHLKPDPLPSLMTVSDHPGEISRTVIPDDPTAAPVPPGFPAVLSEVVPSHAVQPQPSGSTGRRTALARWIADPANPLTVRVIVNRIWQQHFGRGLVASANDFGQLGQRPTHPALLDWLAGQFLESGGRFKWLHKLIVTSATWRQASSHPDARRQLSEDPSVQLLWQMPVRRLSAEQIRDAMLLAAGELDRRVGGPSVSAKVFRRGLYVKSFRNRPDELLSAFDMANGLRSVPRRDHTTTPVQALLMFNGPFALERAEKMAGYLRQRFAGDLDAALRYALGVAWGREPTEAEMALAYQFVDGQEGGGAKERRRLADFCHVLLNSNEFLYID